MVSCTWRGARSAAAPLAPDLSGLVRAPLPNRPAGKAASHSPGNNWGMRWDALQPHDTRAAGSRDSHCPLIDYALCAGYAVFYWYVRYWHMNYKSRRRLFCHKLICGMNVWAFSSPKNVLRWAPCKYLDPEPLLCFCKRKAEKLLVLQMWSATQICCTVWIYSFQSCQRWDTNKSTNCRIRSMHVALPAWYDYENSRSPEDSNQTKISNSIASHYQSCRLAPITTTGCASTYPESDRARAAGRSARWPARRCLGTPGWWWASRRPATWPPTGTHASSSGYTCRERA